MIDPGILSRAFNKIGAELPFGNGSAMSAFGRRPDSNLGQLDGDLCEGLSAREALAKRP